MKGLKWLFLLLFFFSYEPFAKMVDFDQPREERLKILSETRDELIIAEFANHDPDWIIRRVAVSKCMDMDIIRDISKDDSNAQVRLTAPKKL